MMREGMAREEDMAREEAAADHHTARAGRRRVTEVRDRAVTLAGRVQRQWAAERCLRRRRAVDTAAAAAAVNSQGSRVEEDSSTWLRCTAVAGIGMAIAADRVMLDNLVGESLELLERRSRQIYLFGTHWDIGDAVIAKSS